jgi:hypothetical protein
VGPVDVGRNPIPYFLKFAALEFIPIDIHLDKLLL